MFYIEIAGIVLFGLAGVCCVLATGRRDAEAQTSGAEPAEPGVEPACAGCEWLREAMAERRRLVEAFTRLGDERLAAITEEGAGDLLRDWQAHVARDHPQFAPSLGALSEAVQTGTGAPGERLAPQT